MKKKKEPKTKRVAAYLTVSEYSALENEFRKSTSKEFADFIRRLLRRKPVVKKYRNKSLDDILQCLVEIKTNFESAGWNFAKVIKRLQDLPPGNISREIFESLLAEEFSYMARARDAIQLLNKIYERCLQLQTPPQGLGMS